MGKPYRARGCGNTAGRPENQVVDPNAVPGLAEMRLGNPFTAVRKRGRLGRLLSVIDLAQADQAGLDRTRRAAVSSRNRRHSFAGFKLTDQNLLFGCIPCLACLSGQFTRPFPRQSTPQGYDRCSERLYRCGLERRLSSGKGLRVYGSVPPARAWMIRAAS
jgi:hypothetical protein